MELLMPDLITLAYAPKNSSNDTKMFTANLNLGNNLLSSVGFGFKFIL